MLCLDGVKAFLVSPSEYRERIGSCSDTINLVSTQSADPAPILSVPILQVQDLSIGFGRCEAVHGISFAIGAGQVLGLVGESG